MPPALDLIVQTGLTPRESLAADRVLLDGVSAAPGVLRIHELAGDVLALGRYHVAPPPVAGGAALWRRVGGGRVVPAGDGFVGLSLLLPHRAALVADEPSALRPEQVLNRYVRGILGACERAGIAALYPGRDTITVGGRIVGVISLEVEATGRCLFEAVLGVGRDFSVLPRLLESADPGGTVQAAMLGPADATCLARELGGAPALAQVVDWLREGYAARLGATCTPRALTEAETGAIRASIPDFGDRWLRSRARRGDRRGAVATQLGVLEASFTLRDRRLREVTLVGDFIASSPAVARVEQGLDGCAAEAGEIARVVEGVFAHPASFILGIGAPGTIAEAIARGLPA